MGIWIGIVVWGLFGIVFLIFPRQIQKWALRSWEKHPVFRSLTPGRRWVESEAYVWSTRALGCLSIAIAGILLYLRLSKSLT